MGTLRIVGGEISGKEIEPSESLQNVRGCLPNVALQHEPIAQGSPPCSSRASPSVRTITKIKLRRQLLLNVTILLDGSVVSVVQKVFVEEFVRCRLKTGFWSELSSQIDLAFGGTTHFRPADSVQEDCYVYIRRSTISHLKSGVYKTNVVIDETSHWLDSTKVEANIRSTLFLSGQLTSVQPILFRRNVCY